MKKQNIAITVGLGVMLGIAALTVGPKSAQASTPCSPQLPPNTTCHYDIPVENLDCRLWGVGPSVPDGCYYTDAQNCFGLGAYNKHTEYYTCIVHTDNEEEVVFECEETIRTFAAICYVA